ncbi:hypothetical protein APY04_3477 [Hyphomicrobium sulfonivorans]|uniref:Uncharacterized protein n=1 Tax=Hyphomicrobium sulfonivorans TaxID=121290 RepID=A0A125NTQ6_HYPSL|nr:hypothetical protein APY04_3477 [Hyphomicrobium sulfonivorans]
MTPPRAEQWGRRTDVILRGSCSATNAEAALAMSGRELPAS